MNSKGSILISDVNKGLSTALVLLLKKYFFRVDLCTKEEIIPFLQKNEVNILLIDLASSSSAVDAENLLYIKALMTKYPNMQVLVMLAFSDLAFGNNAVKNGAFDYIVKPWNNDKLVITLCNAYKMSELSKENSLLRNKEKKIVDNNYRSSVPEEFLLGNMEILLINRALSESGGNVSKAASLLGITRQTLYNKAKMHKINLIKNLKE